MHFYYHTDRSLFCLRSVSVHVVFFRQPLSPSSQRRLKQLTDKHGSGKIYQVMGTVVGSRDLDLNLAKGELVAVISEADSRGDKRRWLVDAGGTNHLSTGLLLQRIQREPSFDSVFESLCYWSQFIICFPCLQTHL